MNDYNDRRILNTKMKYLFSIHENSWFDNFFIINMFLLLCIFFFRLILPIYSLISLCFYLSVLIEVLAFFKCLSEKNRLSFVTVLLLLLSLISCCYGSDTFNFEYMKRYICYCSMILFFYISYGKKLNSSAIRFVNSTYMAIALMFVVHYLLYPHARLAGGLLFNYGNPNEAGLWLFQLFAFIGITLFFPEQKKSYILFKYVILALILFFILQTKSRTALGAALLFLCMCFFYEFIRSDHVSMFIGFLFVIVPIVFGCLYLLVVNSDFIKSLFSFLISEGKSLTSRVLVWRDAVELIKLSPVFGNYSLLLSGSYMEHMHNIYFDVAARYGLPDLFLLIVFFYFVVEQFANRKLQKYQLVGICAFFVTIAFGTFESALVYGSTGLPVMVITYLIIAQSSINNQRGNEI